MTRRASVASWLALAMLAGCNGTPDADVILRGGTLVDGTGAAARRADVAVLDGRIAAIGDLGALEAATEIDATGLVVAPGFVDMHSHADLIVLADRTAQEKLLAAKVLQGVTTIVVGNCGLGTAPADLESTPILAAVNAWMTPSGVHAAPLDVNGYLDRLEGNGVALNVGTLVPHGPVRIGAMGLVAGEPSPDQLESMRRSVAEGLRDGAFGLSVGLIYPPGMYSATDELVALAEVVRQHDGVFTAHVRGSSELLLDATGELLEIARRSGARVHHSHLEAVGEPFWPAIERVLDLEDRARAEGARVTHDVFPYTRAATMMAAIFPPWSLEGGIAALVDRLAEPSTSERIRADIAEQVPTWPPWNAGGWPHNLVRAVGWDGILVASVASGSSPLVGKSLAAIARDEGSDPYRAVVDLMRAEEGKVGQQVDEISGRDESAPGLLAILEHPAAAIVSDAEDYGRGSPHPAHAGAFARALRIARERGVVPLEEIVRRMTGHPASIVGLADRGTLRPGAWADVVVFDPARVRDRATWDEPRLPASGIVAVLVNGIPVVRDGVYAGGLAGQVLRSTSRKPADSTIR